MPPQTIGTRIRETRKTKGWSQATLGTRCGLSKSTISDIERDKSDPKISQLSAICLCLGLDLNYVCGFEIPELSVAFGANVMTTDQWQKFLSLKLEFKRKVHREITFLGQVQDSEKETTGRRSPK